MVLKMIFQLCSLWGALNWFILLEINFELFSSEWDFKRDTLKLKSEIKLLNEKEVGFFIIIRTDFLIDYNF